MTTYEELIGMIGRHPIEDQTQQFIDAINQLDVIPDPPPNSYNYSILRDAIISGNVEFVRILLSKGASVDSSSPYNELLLHDAITENNSENATIIANLLIDAGADISEVDDGFNSVFYVACAHGLTKLAERLIKLGFDNEINPDDDTIYPAIHAAIENDQLETTELLIKHGSLIHDGIRLVNNVKMLNLLIKYYGPQCINEKNDAYVPIMLDIMGFSDEVIIRLIELGANINVVDRPYDKTPLHYYVSGSRPNIDIVRLLLESGIDKDIKDKYGETALDIAKKRKLTDIAELIENYFDPLEIKEPDN